MGHWGCHPWKEAGYYSACRKESGFNLITREVDYRALLGGSVEKNPLANAGDTGHAISIPGSGRSPGGRNGTLLQYSCLQGQRRLVGHGLQGHKESDTAELLSTHTSTRQTTVITVLVAVLHFPWKLSAYDWFWSMKCG